MYAVRTLRKQLILARQLPNDLFKWVWAVIQISDDDVLECLGLDAYAVMCFFRMGIEILMPLTILATLVLSPLRYYFTGNYDRDSLAAPSADPPLHEEFPRYMWLYPVFTYGFSVVVCMKLFKWTTMVIKTRQKYLASQNSITDRTIKLDEIPKKLISKNDPAVLKRFVEELGIGNVVDVKLLYDFSPLEQLFRQRKSLISRLETLYLRLYGVHVDLYNSNKVPRVIPENAPNPPTETLSRKVKIRQEIDTLAHELCLVDAKITHTRNQFDTSLSTFSSNSEFKILSSAFITMEDVASAQMAAQTVLDPRVFKLIVSLAPAPKDINWENLKLQYLERVTKSYLITFFIFLSYLAIFFLVTTLSTLLDVKTITKFWPALGHLIADSKWLSTFVTGILPPMLFSLMNLAFPYLYKYLTQLQGYPLTSDVELASLLKNFFFIFFILFLVFTITGTLWDYVTSIGDTTRFASQLASSLRKLSLFYVDLILLQGLAMFPVKLLQIGDFVILNVLGKMLFLKNIFLRTPRDYRFFYFTPPVFDFGLNLPQHILILIIILIYSVVSTKIVASGLVYFVLGYFVYKYQLMYSFVHPPHSTGKVWPMIFRRVIFGLMIFQIFMCGTLALEGAILLTVLCVPLLFVSLIVWWNFEQYYVPLHTFIALRAMQTSHDYDKEFDDDTLLVSIAPDRPEISGTTKPTNGGEEQNLRERLTAQRTGSSGDIVNNAGSTVDNQPSDRSLLLDGDFSVLYTYGQISHRRKISTVDEEREQFSDYTHPYLREPLNGPWIGFEGDYISMVEYRTPDDELHGAEIEIGSLQEFVVRKKIEVAEWE